MTVREIGPGETALAARTLLELQLGLGTPEALVRQAHRQRATGFRINEFLVWERHVHLDSGLGADRQDAHRLCFRLGPRIAAFHFQREL